MPNKGLTRRSIFYSVDEYSHQHALVQIEPVVWDFSHGLTYIQSASLEPGEVKFYLATGTSPQNNPACALQLTPSLESILDAYDTLTLSPAVDGYKVLLALIPAIRAVILHHEHPPEGNASFMKGGSDGSSSLPM